MKIWGVIMEINHTKSYIDKSVMITQELPANLQNFIAQLQEADKNNPIRYFDIYDDLDINAKNAYACGYITKDTWNRLQRKYYFRALAVEHEEALSTVIYDLNDPDIQAAICRVVPRIKEKLPDMIDFIERIPHEYQGYEIISEIRQQEYAAELKTRTEALLLPAYEKAKSMTSQ